MNRRKILDVNLVLFQDDQTGDYGVTHEATKCSDNGFNAFWNGIGIFHDVFEHYFEHTHKYFKGDYALNRGGECVAMGAAFYYWETLGVYNRPLGSYHNFSDSIRMENENAIQEAISEGYSSFGSTLECAVPKQRPVDNGELEYQIKTLWDNVKTVAANSEYEDQKESGKEYKKSVTFRKLSNLYRYGYRMAQQIVPDNRENQNMMVGFIEFFNSFCKNNSAEELESAFRKINFRIYKDKNGVVTWKAKLISKDSFVSDVKITSEHQIEIYYNENY